MRLLVLLAGCLPLILLTFSTVLDLRTGEAAGKAPVASSQLSAEEQAAASQLATSLEAAATADQQPLAQLVEWNLVAREPLPELDLVPEAAERYATLEEDWADVRQTQAIVKKYMSIYDTIATAEEEQEQLTSFVADDALRSLRRGDALVRHVNDRLQQLEGTRLNQGSLKDAETLFTVNKQYDKCLEKLETIQIDLLSDDDRTRVANLRDRATFWNHWKKLPSFGESLDSQLDGLRAHLKNSPQAPEGDLDAAAILKRKNEEAALLASKIRIREFLARTPEELSLFLEEAQAVLVDNAAAGVQIRRAFRDWLDARLGKKSTAAFDRDELKRMVAQLKEGGRLFGVFELTNKSAARNDWRYKYWRNVAEHPAEDKWESRYLIQFLEMEEPQVVIDQSGISDYSKQRDSLLAEITAERPSTRVIQRQCEALEALCLKLDEEQLARDPEFDDLRFNKEQRVAEDILKHWAQVESILKN